MFWAPAVPRVQLAWSSTSGDGGAEGSFSVPTGESTVLSSTFHVAPRSPET